MGAVAGYRIEGHAIGYIGLNTIVTFGATFAVLLVGTILMHPHIRVVPLVLAAAIGHLLWGEFEMGLTGSLLLGAVPGVIIGAHVSSRAPDAIIRPILVLVLALSGLKLLDVPNELLGAVWEVSAGDSASQVVLRRVRAEPQSLTARGGPMRAVMSRRTGIFPPFGSASRVPPKYTGRMSTP